MTLKLVVDNTQPIPRERALVATPIEMPVMNTDNSIVWYGPLLGQWLSLVKLGTNQWQLLWATDCLHSEVEELLFDHWEEGLFNFCSTLKRMSKG